MFALDKREGPRKCIIVYFATLLGYRERVCSFFGYKFGEKVDRLSIERPNFYRYMVSFPKPFSMPLARRRSGYGSIDQELIRNYSPEPAKCPKFCAVAKFCCRILAYLTLIFFVSVLIAIIIYYGSQWFQELRVQWAQSRKVRYSGSLAGKNCTNFTCGVQPTTDRKLLKIVGGQTSVPYSWPWQVALFEIRQSNRGSKREAFVCGASLISDQWILTAAHCVNLTNQYRKYFAKLGVFDEEDFVEPGEIVADVESIFVHPSFDKSLMYYDVALLKLSEPIICNDHVYPICLPDENEDLPPVNASLTAIGWGKNTEKDGGGLNIYLKQTELPLVSENACEHIYGPIINYFYNFCAGYKDGVSDTCQGDSGGPIMYKTADNQWIQLGITSWGDKCALPYRPGVYTRLSTSVGWIFRTLSHNY